MLIPTVGFRTAKPKKTLSSIYTVQLLVFHSILRILSPDTSVLVRAGQDRNQKYAIDEMSQHV